MLAAGEILYVNVGFYFSHAEPSGWSLQAPGGGHILPGKSPPSPVGAWTGPTGALNGVVHLQTHERQILMSRRIWGSSRHGPLELLARTRGFLSATSETVEDWFLWSVLCKKFIHKSRFTSRPHCFYTASKTKVKLLFCPDGHSECSVGCATNGKRKKTSTPQLVPGVLSKDRNVVVVKLCPTFLGVLSRETCLHEWGREWVVCVDNTCVFP